MDYNANKGSNGTTISSISGLQSETQVFVERFFDHKDLFTDHEVEYLKNNCEYYPGELFPKEYVRDFGGMADEIDIDDILEKMDESDDNFDDWTGGFREIDDNPFRKDWDEDREYSGTKSGMYEPEDELIGMFETEEQLDRLEELERIMKDIKT